mmetsp:Transcript_13693/g.39448  ORF Transcript_13693/g.39448 Transcript_13693/m.39448 type:complete len:222 (-) Transcript_13693:150-815(-)
MPCKEHRDVCAGFAFVNFRSPSEVLALWDMVQSNLWSEMRVGDPQCKPLAMSYARFQGHDELVAHFSTSVVLHEQDPEKRPIFCHDAGSNKSKQGGGGGKAAASKRGAAAGSATAAATGPKSAQETPPGLPVKLNVPSATALAAQADGGNAQDKEPSAKRVDDQSGSTATPAATEEVDGPVYLPTPLTWAPKFGVFAGGDFKMKGDVVADANLVHPASIGA